MDSKLMSAVGIIVLAAVIRIPSSSISGSSGEASGKASVERPAAAVVKTSEDKDLDLVAQSDLGPWYATCEFASATGAAQRAPARKITLLAPLPDPPGTNASRWCLPTDPKSKYQYQFLFATVPDPQDSHLALEFDRRMEAIVDAAQAAQFSYDRYWLPWQPGYVPSQDTSEGHEKILRQLRMEQPGLLLFRGPSAANDETGGAEQLLFVFLIGETPTAGIRHTQFANAMRYMGEIDRTRYSDPAFVQLTGTVPLLGPSFSGSAYSLRSAIQKFVCPKDDGSCFHLVSSSATNRSALDDLRDSSNICLTEVLHDDEYALRHFLTFTHHQLHIRNQDIALLTEDATDYAHNAGENFDVLTITFPREIAQLRNAYPDPTTVGADGKTVAVPQQGLTLTLKGSPTSQDDVPPFSAGQLPLSQEAVLLNIASTLRREQIRMVGILATDIFDTLFLSRFLRSACPDIRIFVIQSDLLMARATEEIPLEGAMAVTTYPLIGRNQYWTSALADSRRHRNLLASSPTESTYNATLVLLQEITGASDSPLDYSSPLHPGTTQPPLWLTVIGHNGYWPLALLDEQESADHPSASHSPSLYSWPAPAPSDTKSQSDPTIQPGPMGRSDQQMEKACVQGSEMFECEPPPLLWTLLFSLVCCVALVYVAAVWLARWYQKTRKFWWLEDVSLKTDVIDGKVEGKTYERAFYLAMGSLVLLALVVILAAPAWKLFDFERSPFVPYHSSAFALSYLSALLVIPTLMLTAVHLSVVFFRHKFTYRMVWAVIGWALCLFLSVSWIGFCFRFSHDPAFFAYRALDLASGTSPATPFVFVLVAFFIWSRIHMYRLRFSETRRTALPSQDLGQAMTCHSEHEASDIGGCFESAIRELHDRKLLILNLCAFLTIFYLAQPTRFVRSLEGRWFDALFIVCIGLLYFVIFSNWVRFLFGWFYLRQFLRRLERQPIRFAFNRLSKEFSWSPIWKQGGTRRTYLMFTRSNDYLQALLHSKALFARTDKFKKACKTIDDATQQLLNNEAQDRWDNESSLAELQVHHASVANDLIASPLLTEWGKQTTGLLKQPPLKEDKPDPQETNHQAEEYVALRCVVFIRYASLQLRNLLGFLSAGFILSLISLRSYPFQSPRSIEWTMTAVFVVLSAGIVYAFAGMDKDAILSRVSQTEAGKLDREFFVRVVSFGALPLLTVLASQFPSIGRFLFSWVQPGLEALR